MWEKRTQVIFGEAQKPQKHITVVSKDDFDCDNLPSGENWVIFVTEPKTQPEPVYYTITLNTGSGGAAMNSQQVVSGGLAQNPGDAESESCVFTRWEDADAPGVEFDWTQPITKDYTLNAIWECGDSLITESGENITTENGDTIVV